MSAVGAFSESILSISTYLEIEKKNQTLFIGYGRYLKVIFVVENSSLIKLKCFKEQLAVRATFNGTLIFHHSCLKLLIAVHRRVFFQRTQINICYRCSRCYQRLETFQILTRALQPTRKMRNSFHDIEKE